MLDFSLIVLLHTLLKNYQKRTERALAKAEKLNDVLGVVANKAQLEDCAKIEGFLKELIRKELAEQSSKIIPKK